MSIEYMTEITREVAATSHGPTPPPHGTVGFLGIETRETGKSRSAAHADLSCLSLGALRGRNGASECLVLMEVGTPRVQKAL
jgi:hypothetical protein